VNEVFVAALLGVSDERLQIALMLRAILIAAAIFLFVREIAYRLGAVPTALSTIVMLAFSALAAVAQISKSRLSFFRILPL